MKLYIILMVIFSDGTPTLRSQLPVPGSDPRACAGMVWRMMVDHAPGSKWEGHPVKYWSAGCAAGEIGDPT